MKPSHSDHIDQTGPRDLPPLSLAHLDRIQPALLIGSIALGLGIGRFVPELAGAVEPLVSIGVFALIYLVMLDVDLRGIAGAFRHRTFLISAIAINFVLNPLLAWSLAAVFLPGQPDLALGLILFLVTPCIGWYLVFTELARGDTHLGVSLLTINMALQILLLPLYVHLLAGEAIGVEPGAMFGSVAVFLVLPLGLATATRRVLDRSATSTAPLQTRVRLPYVKAATLMGVIVAMFASQSDAIFDDPSVVLSLLAPITLFFATGFVVAVVVGRALRLPYDQVVLLVFTTTSRNSEASLAIAATAFASPLVALTVVLGPAIELPLMVIMVRVLLQLRTSFEQVKPRSVLQG